MISLVIVGVLALLAFAFIALPLFAPRHSDPLPDDSDPVLGGLNEEKAALLRAIGELDARTDLTADRREQLRTRYEAKAAATLKAIDAREAELASRVAGRRGTAAGGAPGAAPGGAPGGAPARRKPPVAAIAVLAVCVVAAALMPTYVLPRVGAEATITSTDMEAAEQLRDLQRAANREPTAENLMALGDAYLALDRAEDAREAYVLATEADGDVPLAVYQSLAVLALQTDLGEAQEWLERAAEAAPEDSETQFLLSGVAFANGDMATSEAALRRHVALEDGAPTDFVAARLELFERGDELRAAVEADPTAENLSVLADLYWRAGDTGSAVDAYLRLLSEVDADDEVALARMGEVMLQSGAPSDAAALIEHAASVAGGLESLDPQGVLVLGEAYLRLGRFDDSVTTLETYLALEGDAANPVAAELLASARSGSGAAAGGAARDSAGGAAAASPGGPQADAGSQASGATVFAESCASCHGPGGQGGMGPTLAGNPRAANESNVRDAVAFGRGMMPGFAASLSPEELEAVVAHVVQDVSQR